MASLKEVKARIASVSSTQKITSAMKMVSSAKLKKAQKNIESIGPYQTMLNRILGNFLQTETDIQSVFSEKRNVQKLAIVVFSSNSSLCGAFNSNVIKRFKSVYDENKGLGNENILIYPIGQKIYTETKKLGLNVQGNYKSLADKPSYDEMTKVTSEIMEKFQNKEIDRVIAIYHHLKSTSSQQLITKDFLPINLDEEKNDLEQKEANENKYVADYIVEPNKVSVINALLPKALKTKLFAYLLDSNASEHAARVVAMQIANDNAETMLHDLTVLYNKTRQAAITSELLDIVGGAAALEK